MKFTQLQTISRSAAWVHKAAWGLLVALLVACGGGTRLTPTTDVSASPGGLRPLPSTFTSRKAAAYEPNRTATTVGNANLPTDKSREVITDAMVLEDLRLLVSAGIGVIRLFDSTEQVASPTLRVIRANNLPIKVQLGIYIQVGNDSFSQDQIARGVALANIYSDIVDTVSVGNETMVYWSSNLVNTKVMAGYLAYVRSQINQPITTDDNWAFFANAPKEVLDNIDFVSMHSYVMVDSHYDNIKWDWQQKNVPEAQRAAAMMDAALAATKGDFNYVRSYLDSKGYGAMPVTIGETGWMAVDATGDANWYKFRASPVNQKMYFDRLQTWALESRTASGPKAIIWFEAFDEQWKQADDKWGLFNKDRQARCAAQALNASATWVKEAGSCAADSAVYYNPPVVNPAVTQNLVIHSEAVTGWPDGLRADAYEGGTFVLGYPAVGDSAASDMGATLAGSHYIALHDFTPKSYGWGLLWQSAAVPAVSANMSNFANGAIHFSIKTGYVGSLRIGISSDTETGNAVEANVIVSSGKYGYCNSATTWCDVSIPLSAFQSANQALDLRYVLTRFSIADIYSETLNTARTGMPAIALDNIYWSR